MLRLVKWAYKLGVRNERHRIAGFLANAQANKWDGIRGMEAELGIIRDRDESGTKEEVEAKRLQQKIAVDREVIDIIDALFHGEEKYERGASFMFPEEKES